MKKIGYILIASGFLLTGFILLADLIGVGKDRGIGVAQTLGIQGGVFLLLLGIGFLKANPYEIEFKPQIKRVLAYILDLPIIVWVGIAFVVVFFFFFITPMFFNSSLRIVYFNKYLPDRYPIGNDLILMTNLIEKFFVTGESPYPTQFYPPLSYIFFTPLILIGFPLRYEVITILTLISYFLTFIIVTLIKSKDKSYMVMLFGVSGLLSYGFQFELERGQYNVFAFMLCLLSVYIFHYHKNFSYFAYLLFVLSIQLKIYPAIFIVLFIHDWRDWKNNLKRFIGIGLFNFAALFVMGYKIFLDFLQSVSTQMQTPTGWNWNGNHSIKAFIFGLVNDGSGIVPLRTAENLEQYSRTLEWLLLGVFAACFLLVIIYSYIKREHGFNPYLLVICTIGSLIIPISNDYKLSILAAPMAILFINIADKRVAWKKTLSIFLIFVSSIAYASILFPFKYKPAYLANSFPLLFVMLISVTLLFFIGNKKPGDFEKERL